MKKKELMKKVIALENNIEKLRKKILELEQDKTSLEFSLIELKKIKITIDDVFKARYETVISELSKTNRELTIIAAELKKPAK